MNQLVDLVYAPASEWETRARDAFAAALPERYNRVQASDFEPSSIDGREQFQFRLNAKVGEKNVPFAALIPPNQERSGPYGGMSFVLFPADEPGKPAIICMVVGTQGISPDEMILGRPGHARKVRAITDWLKASGLPFAWAKQDPVRTDLKIPRSVAAGLSDWHGAITTYGHVIYGLVVPPEDRSKDDLVATALKAFADLYFSERDIRVLARYQGEAEQIRRAWMRRLLPSTSGGEVAQLLAERKYVVLEGPPGTGKTRMALNLLEGRYNGNGTVIQFHPGTTYENFVGGLYPESGGPMGFQFAPRAGHLMEAAQKARQSNHPYLLVIDEINRADLSKVLGEAIALFEPREADRVVHLAYEFPGIGRRLSLPENLHVLGTMNSADRSIAILDLAVRRRFAFVPVWPQLEVVEEHGGDELSGAFASLLDVFVEHAPEDAFSLLPGHAYFLGSDDQARTRLATEVKPLLREYLAQGYVAGFADEVRAWINVVSADAQ